MYLLGESPSSVSAKGVACVEASIEDVAYVALRFPSGVLAHVRLSWLDPCKARRITVVGRKKMVVYDDLENLEKLKVYDKRVDSVRRNDTFGDHQFAYHYGSVVSPYIHNDEPLRLQCLHFVDCVQQRKRPLTDGANGLAVVRVIQAAQQSLRDGGVDVAVETDDSRELAAGRARQRRRSQGGRTSVREPEARRRQFRRGGMMDEQPHVRILQSGLRHWWIVLISVVVTTALTIFWVSSKPAVFKSSGTYVIKLDPEPATTMSEPSRRSFAPPRSTRRTR